MKRLLTSLLIVVLLSVAFTSTVSAYTVTATLVTAQGQVRAAGFVQISNDAENITVRYWMRANHCLLESHLHLAATLEEIPQNDGGAIPGQFDYKNHHDCVREFTYEIPFADKGFEMGQTIFIAAHGVVLLPDGTTDETAWGARCGCLEGAQFPGSNWSAYIEYTIH